MSNNFIFLFIDDKEYLAIIKVDEKGNIIPQKVLNKVGVCNRKMRQSKDKTKNIDYYSLNWIRNNKILMMKSIFENEKQNQESY